MTVENQFPYQSYTANGSQTDFTLSFYVEDKSNFVVKKNGSVVSINDYTYTSSNSIRFNAAPRSGDIIAVERDTKPERATTYTTYNNTFRPEALNHDIDRVWRKIQELGVVDWILNNKVDSLKTYVDQQDSAVRQYIDQQNDELKSFLLDEIYKQGVALDQLEDYYNYLMKKLAEIAVNGGWLDSYVATWSGRTQEQKNKENSSFADFELLGDGTDETSKLDLAIAHAISTKSKVYLPKTNKWYAYVGKLDNPSQYFYGDGKIIQGYDRLDSGKFKRKSEALSDISNYTSWFDPQVDASLYNSVKVAELVRVGTASGNATQSFVYDESTSSSYLLAVTNGYDPTAEHAVIWKYDMNLYDSDGTNTSQHASLPNKHIGHQGLGLENNEKTGQWLWASVGVLPEDQSWVGYSGEYVVRFKYDDTTTSKVDSTLFQYYRLFDTYPSASTGSLTPAISSDGRYLIVKHNSEASYSYRIRVFELSKLTQLGFGDRSNDYLYEFYANADESFTRGYGLQGLASDGNVVACLFGDASLSNTNELAVFTLDGRHISTNYSINAGLAESTVVYEPESIQFSIYNGVPVLFMHLNTGESGSRSCRIYAYGRPYRSLFNRNINVTESGGVVETLTSSHNFFPKVYKRRNTHYGCVYVSSSQYMHKALSNIDLVMLSTNGASQNSATGDTQTGLRISNSQKAFSPLDDGLTSLGRATARFSVVYAATGTISTSDERFKQQFRSQTEAEKSAALEIKNSICLYKFNDAVDLKGDGARWHVGVKAQQVISILENHGLNPFDYGFICYDEWNAKPEIIEDGEVIQEAEEAGSRYAIRYDELAMFILSSI